MVLPLTSLLFLPLLRGVGALQMTAAEGNGPVDALSHALRYAIHPRTQGTEGTCSNASQVHGALQPCISTVLHDSVEAPRLMAGAIHCSPLQGSKISCGHQRGALRWLSNVMVFR